MTRKAPSLPTRSPYWWEVAEGATFRSGHVAEFVSDYGN